MIDKLDVRIPRKTPFTPEFQEVYSEAARKGHLRPSGYYARAADFRPYGYQVHLHMFSNFGRQHNGKIAHDHKLELYDTAMMSFDQMVAEIRRVFVCEPLDLRMMRRDVCVDVKGVPLDWFKSHARVEFKRNVREMGYMVVTKRTGETLYFGEKPNQFRIYNKIAELLYQYGFQVREAKKKGIPIGSFQEVFGYSESDLITRVERQYGGSQCNGTIRSLLTLERGNPFAPLKLLDSSVGEISPIGMDCTHYWAAKHLRHSAQENGLQFVRAEMTDLVGPKNIKKTWDRFVPYLATADGSPGIDEDAIRQLYLASTYRQMGS